MAIEPTIHDYPQGLQQYAAGAQLFFDFSTIIDPQRKLEEDPEKKQPNADPDKEHFEPFEILFLKDEKEIAAQSLNPGGKFMMYLPSGKCIRKLIPHRTGFKVKEQSVIFWKAKNVQGPVNADGWAMIDPHRSGKIYLYITYDCNGIVCFEEDKPDEKNILRAVLLCELELPPPGLTAKDWDFRKHIKQNHIGVYEMVYDPFTLSLGTDDQGVDPMAMNVAAALRVKKVCWNGDNGVAHQLWDSENWQLEKGKILCMVMRYDEHGEAIDESRNYNSIDQIIADQKAKHSQEYIFPVFQTDEFGNVVNDFRLMPYVLRWR